MEFCHAESVVRRHNPEIAIILIGTSVKHKKKIVSINFKSRGIECVYNKESFSLTIGSSMHNIN